MKKLLTVCICLLQAGLLYAVSHTMSESYGLLEFLVDRASGEWVDCITEEDELSDEVVEIQYPTMLSLFKSLSNTVYATWTTAEREAAFNSALESIVHTNRSLISKQYERNVFDALSISADKAYTNAVGPAEKILRAPCVPCKEAALEVVLKFMPPSTNKTALVLSAILNRRDIQEARRYSALERYVEELKRLSEGGYSVKTNAASIFYENRRRIENLMDVDSLLKSSYSTYSTSSNRLLLAMTALRRPSLTHIERGYFVSVTNTLHLLNGPIAVVPGL